MQSACPRHVTEGLEGGDSIKGSQSSVLRHARLMGYSLNDLAETTGLTVSEIDNNIKSDGRTAGSCDRLASVLGVQVKLP